MAITTLSKGIIEIHKDPKKKIITFDIALARMPKEYVAFAKQIDGDAYTESCFAFQYRYLISANRFMVNTVDGKETYYIDENGDKHHLDFKLPKNVLDLATEQCNKRLIKMGIKKSRKSRTMTASKTKKTAIKLQPVAFACVYNPDLCKSRRSVKQVVGQLALF